MAYEQRDNEIVLFPNDKKQKDSDPNARGHAKVGGVDFWASAWTNLSKNGGKYQTIKLTPKNEMDQRTEHSESDEVDGIPF